MLLQLETMLQKYPFYEPPTTDKTEFLTTSLELLPDLHQTYHVGVYLYLMLNNVLLNELTMVM